MTSHALDIATIGYAMRTVEQELGFDGWDFTDETGQKLDFNNFKAPDKGDQARFAYLIWEHWDEIMTLDGVTAKASDKAEVLNAFLKEHGFEPQFREINGLGVVSLLDMLVEWLAECSVTTINRLEADGRHSYPAFQVPKQGVEVYLHYPQSPLIKLATKSGHNLWLTAAPGKEPKDDLELALWAETSLSNFHLRDTHPIDTRWAGAIIPMLEMDLKPDLSWLLGLHGHDTDWFVSQAFQQFKLRMNEHGARVKVATGIAVMRGAMAPQPQPYVFDQPFLGYFTQPGHDDVPIAAFWADTDSWRQPAGTLEEL